MLRLVNAKLSRPDPNRLPPWRRWVQGREKVPSVAFTRDKDISNLIKYPEMGTLLESSEVLSLDTSESSSETAISSSDSVLVLSETVDMMTSIVPQFRKFLLPAAPLREQAIEHLDNYCDHLSPLLTSMTLKDKVQLLGAFGQLQDYSVVNRVTRKYNSRKLVYQNPLFFSSLVASIPWSAIHTLTHRPSQLLEVLRCVSRMDLPRDQLHASMSPLIDALVKSKQITPKHLTELVMISSKHRLYHLSLFDAVMGELELNFKGFTPDWVGDIVRGLTSLKFFDSRLISILNREIVPHQLAWWNLVDVMDYYTLAPESSEMTTRMANEVWKWIPDMRCGYVAKAVRILASLEVGDSRTRRSLLRAIPKGLNKLHPHHVAESIIAAVKMNYDPKKKYGRKKFGSLFYRRLAAKLSQNLDTVDPELLVDVVVSLGKIQRPNTELFDAIKKNSEKFNVNQKTRIEKTLADEFARPELMARKLNSMEGASVDTLLYFARSEPNLAEYLLKNHEEELMRMDSDSLFPLLVHDAMAEFATTKWLIANLTLIDVENFSKYLNAIVHVPVKPETLSLLASKINSCSTAEPSILIELVAAYLVLSKYSLRGLKGEVFDVIRNNAIDSLRTIQLAQLVSAHIRTGTEQVSDPIRKFCGWIDNHLVSQHGPVHSSNLHWFTPPGCVTDLNVFPVIIPLALPDPRIDLRKLHTAKDATQVRRALYGSTTDCGIALFPYCGDSKCLLTTIREQYLKRLGWSVKYTEKLDNTTDPSIVTNSLVSNEYSLRI